MQCEEFKTLILNGIEDEETIKHISNCENCRVWLNKELSKPPEGFSQEKWNKLKNNITNINSNIEKTTIKSAEKSFWDYYFSGLKYGIVFGLAIVIGFSIIQNKTENNVEINSQNSESLATDTTFLSNDSSISSITIDINRDNQ